MRQRAEEARETYAHAREEGADRISAGLAALRAAAQRQGIGHEQGREREAARDSIKERLARLRESGPERAHGADAGSIEEQLARLRGRGEGRGTGQESTAEAARKSEPRQEHGLSDMRERLERLLEQENRRTHESIRERLDEALGRAKPAAREGPAHEQEHEREALRRGPSHGWGL